MRYLYSQNILFIESDYEKEFIIRTRRARYPDIFVSRRYGDFKTLADEVCGLAHFRVLN